MISLAVLVVAGVAAFFMWPTINALIPRPVDPVACTTEAKICPDGSAVGRSGPHCEFAACPGVAADYKNGTYMIGGQPVELVDGVSEISVSSSSASKIVTKYFGNDALGDLNGDATPDAAFILTQNSGGSGTFYYVVAALMFADGYYGTNAVLLGDRIAPQTTGIKDGQVIVNYADRKEGEPMTAKPSVGVSKYFKVEGEMLAPVRP